MTAPILLLTRPEAQSHAFVESCRAAGYDGAILVSPIMQICPVPWNGRPAPDTVLLFTSANAVRQAAAQSDLRGFHAVGVGDKTAQVARDHGMTCRSAGGNVDDLVALLLADPPTGPLLHLRGAHSTGDLTARLSMAGLAVQSVVVYDQVPVPLSDDALRLLGGDVAVVLPLFSPRSAALLSERTRTATAPIRTVAISAAAAAAWSRSNAPAIADRPDGPGMARRVAETAREMQSGSDLVGRGLKS